MLSCTNCGLENKDTFAYCVRCGTTLERHTQEPAAAAPAQEFKECPRCGASVPSMFRFCGTCGHPFEDSSARSSLHKTQQSPILKRDTFVDPPSSNNTAEAISRVTLSIDEATLDTIPTRLPTPKKIDLPTSSLRIAKLVVINHDGTEGSVIPLSGRLIELGRDSFVSTLREDPCLSPKHIRIQQTPGGYEITDISAGNGVFITVPQEPISIAPGNTIRFGRQLAKFTLLDPLDSVVDPNGTRVAGSPHPDYWGLLSLISYPDVTCQAFPLRNNVCTIGREFGDAIVPNDLYVSGSHFQIARTPDGFTIRDLESSNGTYLQITHPVTVRSGDRIMMGQQLFLLRYDS